MKKILRKLLKSLLLEIIDGLLAVRPEQLHALADKLAAGDVDVSGIDDKAADVLRFLAKNTGFMVSMLRGFESLLEDDTP